MALSQSREPEPDELPLDEELELVPPLDAAVEPDDDAVETEPDDDEPLNASPSGPAPDPSADPPASSPGDWFELPEEPHAITSDATAVGSRMPKRGSAVHRHRSGVARRNPSANRHPAPSHQNVLIEAASCIGSGSVRG